MKTIALLQLLLLPLACLLHDVPTTAAQESKLSADCNPWSANYWGDVRISTQSQADELSCFRRIVGSVTLIQTLAKPIVLPKLHGVVGDLRIVFSTAATGSAREPRHVLAQILPMLENVSGHISLEYRSDSLLPSAAVSVVDLAPRRISR
jgi:hypothetical protein